MRIILLLVSLLLSGVSQAEVVNPNYIYSVKIVGRFKMTEVSPYKDIYPLAMRYIMLGSKLNGSNSRFCAIGYELQGEQRLKHRESIIFWDKGKIIVRWQAEKFELNNDATKAATMIQSPFIPYSAIRPREAITPWMSSAVVKEDVDAMRADCERNGDIISINAFSTPKACEDYLSEPECIEALLALQRKQEAGGK